MANARMNALFTSLERHADRRSLELFEARRRIARLETRNQELERHSRELQAQMMQLAEQARTARSDFKPARSKGFAALMERRPRRDLTPEASQDPKLPPEVAQVEASQVENKNLSSRAEVEATAEPPVEPAQQSEISQLGAQQPEVRQPEAAEPRHVEAPSPPPETSLTAPTAQPDAPSPQALLNQWYQRYTDAFFKGHTRPLKVGIHEELMAREPWPEKLVRRALACYVHLPRYLKAVREGTERVGLDGEAAGLVDAGEAEHAHQKLEELRAKKRSDSPRAVDTLADKKPVDKKPAKPISKSGKPRHEPRQAAKKNAATDQTATSEPKNFDQKLSALLAKHQK